MEFSTVQVKKKLNQKKGQIGIDPENENKISPKLEEQTKQTLKNLGEILKAGNSDFDKVMKTTVLLSDMNDFAKVNEIYSTCKFLLKMTIDFVSEPKPARACFAVKTLPKNVLVEIECVAKSEK
jgi:2-iminobutanoate/2-iminopropanoate deaminase